MFATHRRLSAAVAIAATALLLAACGPRQVSELWPDGKLRRSGTIDGRKQEGTWTYWYANGQKQAEGTWLRDQQEGVWQWWHENGKPKQAGGYRDGLRTGPWQYWYDNGSPYCVGDYARDLQVGVWRYFHQSGKPSAVGTFIGGAKAMLWTWYDEQGRLSENGAFFQGMKVGPWTTWNADGSSKGSEDHGCPPGWQCYREPATGEPVRRWGLLKDQRPNGVWSLWSGDGKPLATALLGGDSEPWLAWHGTVQPFAGGSYRIAAGTPQREGTWRFWYEDGSRACAGQWTAGHMDAGSGWHPDGSGWSRSGASIDLSAPAPSAPASPNDALSLDQQIARFDRALTTLQTAIRAPLVDKVAPTPAVVAKLDLAPPPKEKAALSPIAIIPGNWTEKQWSNSKGLITLYQKGAGAGVPSDYGPDEFAVDAAARQRRDLLNKPLSQTRMLSSTGEVLDLADHVGKEAVVLVIMRGFAGQVCVYCSTQTAALSRNIDQFTAAGSAVILVYPGAAESVPAFIEAVQSLGEGAPKMPIALDVDLLLVRGLKIEDRIAKPTTLIIDKQGVVRYAYMGATIADRPAADELLKQVKKINQPPTVK